MWYHLDRRRTMGDERVGGDEKLKTHLGSTFEVGERVHRSVLQSVEL